MKRTNKIKTMSVEQAGGILDVCYATALRMAKRGELPLCAARSAISHLEGALRADVEASAFKGLCDMKKTAVHPSVLTDFNHLFQLCKALRLAEKGNLPWGIQPNEQDALRLRTALDFFLAEHESRKVS